ncbi:MAG: NAD(P)-dependent oxidoreductase [Candidatus Schekmanbacteria bacterium]|nr:MAG: NAD(P)-dependent oxidoreductase [Candidatus Schekmanbacteria bacterium]
MKVLVTGGGGFVGRYLCKALKERNWETFVIDIKPFEESGLKKDMVDKYVEGEITNYEKVRQAMDGIDMVIHLAAKHRFFGITEEEFYRVNVEGTKNILKAMDDCGVKKIFFYSSVAVYGDHRSPTNENVIPKPTSIYGKSKLEAEKKIEEWVEKGNKRGALILRPTVIFGPENRGNIYRLIRQIDRYLFIPVGEGNNIKSTAYVENIINATMFLIDRGFEGVEIYSYADEPHLSFKEIVTIIYKYLGKSMPKLRLPVKAVLAGLKPVDSISSFFNIDLPFTAAVEKMNKTTHHEAKKIRQIGFKQIFSLEEGLERTIRWYKNKK